MLIEINDISYFIASVSYFFPVVTLIIKRQIGNLPLFFYVLINLLSVLLSYIFLIYLSNSFPIFHLSVFLSTAMLIFYLKVGDPKYQWVYKLMFIYLCGFFIMDIFLLKGIWENNFYTTVFSNICLALLSLRQLFILLNEDENGNLFSFESSFYIAISILILNSSTFFFSVLESRIRAIENEIFMLYTFPLFMFFIIIHNCILSIGLWKKQKV